MCVVRVSGLGEAGTFDVGAFGASEWALMCGAFLWDTCCFQLQKYELKCT